MICLIEFKSGIQTRPFVGMSIFTHNNLEAIKPLCLESVMYNIKVLYLYTICVVTNYIVLHLKYYVLNIH